MSYFSVTAFKTTANYDGCVIYVNAIAGVLYIRMYGTLMNMWQTRLR